MAELTTALPWSQQIDGDVGGIAAPGYFPPGMRLTPFSFTGATADGDTIPLVRLPGGAVRIYPQFSFISFSDTWVATADAHLGHQAYVDSNGDAVAADDNEWLDNSDVGGGAIAGSWTSSAPVYVTAAGGAVAVAITDYDAQDGLVIEVLIDTEASDDATASITGWVAWAPVGTAQ